MGGVCWSLTTHHGYNYQPKHGYHTNHQQYHDVTDVFDCHPLDRSLKSWITVPLFAGGMLLLFMIVCWASCTKAASSAISSSPISHVDVDGRALSNAFIILITSVPICRCGTVDICISVGR